MNAPNQPAPAGANVSEAVAAEAGRAMTVYRNVQSNWIVVSEDRLQLCLFKHLRTMEAKRGWHAPLGLAIAIVLTLVTTTFHDWVLDAAMWHAMFVLVGIADLCWLAIAIIRALKAPTVEDIAKELKRQPPDEPREYARL